MPETLNPNDADRLALSLFESAGVLAASKPFTWLARDPANKSSVLIKRLRPETPKARITQALGLSHAHVVRTRRWLNVGGNLYAIRDVIRGRNLHQQLAGVGFKHGPDLLEKLLLPLLAALETAHGQGIVHGGISAENVLVADDGRILVSDFALSDPNSLTHATVYKGVASVPGDIQAAGQLITRFLPTGGAFSSEIVRARVSGIIERCDSLSDLREMLIALDSLARAPVPQSKPVTVEKSEPHILPAVGRIPEWIGPPPLPEPSVSPVQPEEPPSLRIDEPASNPESWVKRTPTASPLEPVQRNGVARLSWRVTETEGIHVPTGGGGSATIILTNDGDATLTIRMVATQRAWLNVRPMELPVRLPGGASVPIDFSILATKLSPGEYKSEVYFSASAGGRNAEDLRGGWFKHIAEIRVNVEGALSHKGEKPPYPQNAPTIPAPPGCALLLFLGTGTLLTGLIYSLRVLFT